MRSWSLKSPRASMDVLLPATILLAAILGCHRHGDPVAPSQSLSGRWLVPSSLDVGVTLELLDAGDGTLTGAILVDDEGAELGKYAIQEGSVVDGEFAFTIDPLDPPLLGVLELLGRADPIRFSGRLDTRETLILEIEQECDTLECFDSETGDEFSSPFFTSNTTLERPFGVGGSFANLALEQSGDAVTGFISIVFGSSQGGTAIPALPVHDGGVTDSNQVFFTVDPAEDPTGALAESLGCSSPIVYFGEPQAGSTIRFRAFQRDVVGVDTTVCVNGFATWSAAEVFDAFAETTSVALGVESQTLYDMVISTTQDGSIVSGSVTFENTQVREGPFTIEEGRFSGGVLTFQVRPAELGSLALVTALGSAAPIAFEMRIVGGLSVEVTARQDCPCLEESLVAPRIPVGL